jgi:resuscitation-promoting factor RpfB
VRILVDGGAIVVPEAGKSVRDALSAAHVTLGPDDEVSPALDAAVPNDGAIRVRRITYREGTVDTKIPYRTVIRPATRGNRPTHPTVTREGRSGIKRLTYRAKIMDGSEMERKTVGEAVVREPVHQIVTSRKPIQLGSRGAYAGRKTLLVEATAYDPGPGSCGKWADGKTCNGKRAGYGIIAVDPTVIPLGTKLFVPGYGYGIAADVGSAIKGNRIDLGYNSRSGAIAWGRKQVRIQIVD